MKMYDRILSLLGIYRKAGIIVSGINACKSQIKKDHVFLIILSTDIAATSLKLFKDMCSYRNIPLVQLGTRYDLGKSIGKDMRAVVGIKDKKAADKILGIILQSRRKNTMGVDIGCQK